MRSWLVPRRRTDVSRTRSSTEDESRFGIDQWITDYLMASQYGLADMGLTQTYAKQKIQDISATLPGYMAALRSCPPAFAAQMVRALVLSQARFVLRNKPWTSTPGRKFGTTALNLLEKPWPNATTGELVARMEWHAGLAGSAYVARRPDRLRVLRPDWVGVVYGSEMEPDAEYPGHALDGELLGFAYCNGGIGASQNKIHTLLPSEVAYWTPIPDPESPGRGMSWLTPAIRDMQSDRAATELKTQFFANAGTPNLVVSGITAATPEKFNQIVDQLEERHTGIRNAFRTLYLTAGADATVIGSNLREMDFSATQAAGEPLALDTPIPTPTGWTTMGEIQPGDQVIGRDGLPATVVGVSPIHRDRQCYRVTLKDRTTIVADASHLWVATDRNTSRKVNGRQVRPEKTYTTQQLYDIIRAEFPNGVGGYRLFLPQSPIVELPEADLLVDPYVLGAWLGDGQTAGAAICGARDDLKFVANEIESRGYRTTAWQTGEDKVDVIGVPGGLLASLRALGVLGDKRIPQEYLRASVAQRMDLLRGLMDTDGTVDPGRGQCEFSSKWEYLARQVAELVRSLGYRATVSRKIESRSRTGETWRLSFRVEQDRIPFLLPRKVDRCIAAGDPTVANRSVVSIDPVESVPVRCIAVDTKDHLFLAGDGFVPTHNTRISVLSRVPASVLGILKGLEGSSLNAGNFTAARRIFSDTWIHPTLQDISSALATLVKVPNDADLWFDTSDIPILREDAKDAAEIESVKAESIVKLSTGGFTRKSAVAAVQGQNMSLLVEDPDWVSVQVQPGTSAKKLPASTQE